MSNRVRSLLAGAIGGAAFVSLAAAGQLNAQPAPAPAPQGQPGTPFSGARPDADNQAVIDALKALNVRPYHTLTPQEARLQPSFTDGVMAVMRAQGRPTTPPPGITERVITAGGVPARVFAPANANGPLPVIVYYHGGGWVIADSRVYAPSARALVRDAQAIVVSVDYRRAPEASFPAQHQDSLAAYRWVLANARSIGGDPSRIAIAGESAGGNLAVATAIAARNAGLQMPRHILSVYPIAGSDLNTPSYNDSANSMPLNRALMAWFLHHTARTPTDLTDPRINLVAADFRGLPPTTIVAAQIDVLRSEGELLAQRMQAAGVAVERREWAGATHEFFGADAVIADAREAQAWAGGRLRAALHGGAAAAPATGPAPVPAPLPEPLPAPAEPPLTPPDSSGERG
jgi:acetyl esterase/lipase